MILTLQEINSKIQEQEEMKKRIEEKISSLLETIEFKRMQNGTDSVEVQNITDTINTCKSSFCSNIYLWLLIIKNQMRGCTTRLK